jgi:hypothetical protein
MEQTARVRQPNAVDEIQPCLAPFDHDLADRSFDPATDLGAMIRQAAPQQGFLGVGHGATNYGAQRQDDCPDLGRQGIEPRR